MESRRIKLGRRWLRLTCQSSFLDELEGDLFELYQRDVAEKGENGARWRFLWNAIFSVRFYRLKSIKVKNSNYMLGNYFKVTLRHSARYKVFSTVSLLSLVLGFSTCLYITLFIHNEISYDRFHAKGKDIYRVIKHNKQIDEMNAGLSSRYGQMLATEFPHLAVFSYGNDPVKFGDKDPVMVQSFFWADSTLFDLFSFKLIYGTTDALKSKNSVVLTRTLSEKLFGDRNPVGEVLPTKIYDGNQELNLTVTALLEDIPENSHIRFEAVGSMANSEDLYSELLTYWGFNWLKTYVLAPSEYMEYVNSNMQEVMIKNRGEDYNEFTLAFQPLYDVHLRSTNIDSSRTTGDIRNIEMFAAIGLLVLSIAVFNYINLSTARNLARAKEVGLRKSIGAHQGNIRAQFLAESVFYSFTALLVSMLIVYGTLEFVNFSLGTELSFNTLSVTDIIVGIGAVIFIALIAGIYPATMMAKLHLTTIKSSGSGRSSSITRKILVISQYSITILLITVSLLVTKQYQFMKNYELGFDKHHLINIAVDDREVQKQIKALKNDILQLSEVSAATAAGETLPGEMNNSWNLDWEGRNQADEMVTIDIVGID